MQAYEKKDLEVKKAEDKRFLELKKKIMTDDFFFRRIKELETVKKSNEKLEQDCLHYEQDLSKALQELEPLKKSLFVANKENSVLKNQRDVFEDKLGASEKLTEQQKSYIRKLEVEAKNRKEADKLEKQIQMKEAELEKLKDENKKLKRTCVKINKAKEPVKKLKSVNERRNDIEEVGFISECEDEDMEGQTLECLLTADEDASNHLHNGGTEAQISEICEGNVEKVKTAVQNVKESISLFPTADCRATVLQSVPEEDSRSKGKSLRGARRKENTSETRVTSAVVCDVPPFCERAEVTINNPKEINCAEKDDKLPNSSYKTCIAVNNEAVAVKDTSRNDGKQSDVCTTANMDKSFGETLISESNCDIEENEMGVFVNANVCERNSSEELISESVQSLSTICETSLISAIADASLENSVNEENCVASSTNTLTQSIDINNLLAVRNEVATEPSESLDTDCVVQILLDEVCSRVVIEAESVENIDDTRNISSCKNSRELISNVDHGEGECRVQVSSESNHSINLEVQKEGVVQQNEVELEEMCPTEGSSIVESESRKEAVSTVTAPPINSDFIEKQNVCNNRLKAAVFPSLVRLNDTGRSRSKRHKSKRKSTLRKMHEHDTRKIGHIMRKMISSFSMEPPLLLLSDSSSECDVNLAQTTNPSGTEVGGRIMQELFGSDTSDVEQQQNVKVLQHQGSEGFDPEKSPQGDAVSISENAATRPKRFFSQDEASGCRSSISDSRTPSHPAPSQNALSGCRTPSSTTANKVQTDPKRLCADFSHSLETGKIKISVQLPRSGSLFEKLHFEVDVDKGSFEMEYEPHPCSINILVTDSGKSKENVNIGVHQSQSSEVTSREGNKSSNTATRKTPFPSQTYPFKRKKSLMLPPRNIGPSKSAIFVNDLPAINKSLEVVSKEGSLGKKRIARSVAKEIVAKRKNVDSRASSVPHKDSSLSEGVTNPVSHTLLAEDQIENEMDTVDAMQNDNGNDKCEAISGGGELQDNSKKVDHVTASKRKKRKSVSLTTSSANCTPSKRAKFSAGQINLQDIRKFWQLGNKMLQANRPVEKCLLKMQRLCSEASNKAQLTNDLLKTLLNPTLSPRESGIVEPILIFLVKSRKNVFIDFVSGEMRDPPLLSKFESVLVGFLFYLHGRKPHLLELLPCLKKTLVSLLFSGKHHTLLGSACLVRVHTAICRKEGDIASSRVLCYDLVMELPHVALFLVSSVCGVWPQVFYPNKKGESGILWKVMQYWLMSGQCGNSTLETQSKSVLKEFCGCVDDNSLDLPKLTSEIIGFFGQLGSAADSTTVYNCSRSLELLYKRSDWNPTRQTLIEQELLPLLQSSLTDISKSVVSKNLVYLLGSLCSSQPPCDQTVKNVVAFLMDELLKKSDGERHEVKEEMVLVLLKYADCQIQKSISTWVVDHCDSISPFLRNVLLDSKIPLQAHN